MGNEGDAPGLISSPSYRGPDRRQTAEPRRRCPPGDGCNNLATALIAMEGIKQRTAAEYKSLENLVGELREMVIALPKQLAAQIAQEHSDVDEDLSEGSKTFKQLFKRIRRVERRVLVLGLVVVLVELPKGIAIVLGWIHGM